MIRPLRDRRSVALQLRDELERLISTGQLRPGDRLPSESELCESYDVGRGSVREALKLLEETGMVDVRHGRGRFVSVLSKLRVALPITTLESVTQILRSRNLEAETQTLMVERGTPSEEEAAALELEADAPILRMRRLRLHERRLLVFSENTLPLDLLPADNLPTISFNGSLFAWLEEIGHAPFGSVAEFEATELPTDRGIPDEYRSDDSWMLIRERSVDESGTPIVYSLDYHLGSSFSFRVTRTRGVA